MKQIFYLLLLLLLTQGCGSGSSSSAPVVVEDDPVVNPSPVITEKRPTLLIRVAYNNIDFQNSDALWSSKIFGFEDHQLNSYYNEISYENFNFEPVTEDQGSVNDGVITVTLNKNHPDSGADSVIHRDLYDALTLADTYIDFSQYDTNRNSAISPDELLLVFIIAGNEDAHSGSNAALGVWAHQSCTTMINAPVLDKTTLMGCASGGNYAMFGERHGNNDATIGIIAHELGHAAFDLPDLYDTSERSAGIGYFALMSSGMWGHDGLSDLAGNTPVHMCAWSKTKLNWVEPELFTEASNKPIALHESASESFNIIKLPINTHEYFLLENRNNSGYDRGLEAIAYYFNGGLAIWHIDETIIASHLATNTVNYDRAHKGVDLEEAARAVLDYDVAAYGEKENLYYQSNVDAFTPYTAPSSSAYDGSNSGIYVENISEYGALMSATLTITP
jgi:M6 family metalloprotease-like protein